MQIEHKTEILRNLIKQRDDILLDPAWQRGAVWTVSKKSLLIDSILRSYDIPMLYLRECGNGGPFKYEVVDGQQRLRAIWDYVDDSFAIGKGVEKINSLEISGCLFSQLDATLKAKLKKFKVVIAYVKNAKEPEISILFSRMQMGVRLNPPELRNAIQTPLRHTIDALAREHEFFNESRIPAARFKHQDYMAHAFSITHNDCSANLKATQLMDEYKNISDPNKIFKFSSRAILVLDFMAKINKAANLRITQKWIFIDIFYLLYRSRKNWKDMDVDKISERYVTFDLMRLKYNKEPEALLVGEVSPENKNLYDYIMCFNNEGANKSSLLTRSRVIFEVFKDLVG